MSYTARNAARVTTPKKEFPISRNKKNTFTCHLVNATVVDLQRFEFTAVKL